MKPYLQAERWVPWAVLALVVALVLGAASFLWAKHQWAQDHMAAMEPRYARMLGIQAHRAQFVQAAAAANELLAHYAYPATQDASQAGNDAQQKVRDVFAKAGMDVVSSQVLQPQDDTAFEKVPLSIKVEGELAQLQSALVVLSGLSPAMGVEAMAIQTIGAVKAEVPQKLGAQITVFVLRRKP